MHQSTLFIFLRILIFLFMRSLFSIGMVALSAAVITSCGNNASQQQSTVKFIDKANMDTTVSPAEDFFRYANGAWLDKTDIPNDKTRWGSFDELRDRTN